MTDTVASKFTAGSGRRRGRRALWITAGAVAVLLAGVAIAEAVGWPFLRGPLQRMAERNTGVRIEVGDAFRVRFLLAPGLQVDRLAVGAAAGFEVPYLVAGRDIDVRWRWGDVQRWRSGDAPLRLERLHASQLDANLLRDVAGRATWQIGEKRAVDASKSAQDGVPIVDSLRVAAGRIVVDDRPSNTDLVVTMQSLGEASAAPTATPASASASASAPAPAPASASTPASSAAPARAAPPATAGYQASVKGRHRGMPLDLRVTAGALLPLAGNGDEGEGGALSAPGSGVPFRVEGSAGQARIVFDGRAAALFGPRRLDGSLHLRGPSLARVGEPLGLTLPETAPFDLVGRLAHDNGVWRLVAERFALGRTRLAGDFVLDGNRQPRHLSGTLTGSVLALPDLGPAIGAAAPAQPAPRPGGKVLPQRRFDLPSLRAMSADVQVAVERFEFGGAALAPMTHLRTHILLDAGVLRLDALQAQVAGGRLSGSTRYDGNLQPPRWDADLRFAGVDVAGWVRAVQTPGPRKAAGTRSAAPGQLRAERRSARAQAEAGTVQPVRAYLTGNLAVDMQVQGRGRSTGEILGSLQGRAQASLRDGTMSHLVTELLGLDVAETLGVVLRGDRPLTLRCARVDLGIQSGVATPRLAVLDNPDSTIRVEGSINLRDETLNLRAVARPKDFSPLTLRAPVKITGTLADPKFGIEAGRLAGKAVAAAVLGAVAAPLAALLPFIDRGRAVADPCVATAPAARAASAGANAGSASAR